VPEASCIEHVGSTSVPGLAAKPTVDVLMVVNNLEVMLERREALEALGFEHRPDSFAPEREHLFFRRVVGSERTHHLHVLTATSTEPEDYRLFSDFLRANAPEAALYQAAKIDLADRYATERSRYVAAKEPLVEEILERARCWRSG